MQLRRLIAFTLLLVFVSACKDVKPNEDSNVQPVVVKKEKVEFPGPSLLKAI